MADFKKLKEEALESFEANQDKKYDLNREQINNANNVIKKGMSSSVLSALVKSAGKEKDFNKVWECFTNEENMYYEDFEKYMGYGVSDIERIGRDKFLSTVDWAIENVHNQQWRKDVVHVVICGECKNEFTTFQLDFGLCDKCKESFDMDRFHKSLEAMAKVNPGSAESEAITFASFPEYRELYRKLTDEQIVETIVSRRFLEPNCIFLILELLKNNKEDIVSDVCDELENYINQDNLSRQRHVKLLQLIKDNDIQNIINTFINLEA